MLKNIFFYVVLGVLFANLTFMNMTHTYCNQNIFNVITLLIVASTLHLERQIDKLKK